MDKCNNTVISLNVERERLRKFFEGYVYDLRKTSNYRSRLGHGTIFVRFNQAVRATAYRFPETA